MNNFRDIFYQLRFSDIWTRFLADLKQAFTAPTSDPKVTLMVTLILLIIISIIVITGIIIYLFVTRGRRIIIVTKIQVRETDVLINRIIMLIFFLMLIFTMNYYAHRTQSCLNCHLKQYEMAALKKTPHKGIECIRCHKVPGVAGYIRQKIDFSRMVIVFYLNRDKEKNPAIKARGGVFEASCLGCHEDILKRKIKDENLEMSHKELIGSEFSCVDCHNQVAHPNITKPKKTYSMFGCQTCHDGKQASAECKTCHPKYALGERVAKNIELPKVELPAKLQCYGACHDEKKECLPCHGVTMPHPENWVGERPAHIAYAAFTKKKLCWRCHYDGNKYFQPGRKFCGRCHPIEYHGKDEEVYWSHQRFHPSNCELLCHGPGFCSQYCHGPVAPRSPLPKKVAESYFGYPPGEVF